LRIKVEPKHTKEKGSMLICQTKKKTMKHW